MSFTIIEVVDNSTASPSKQHKTASDASKSVHREEKQHPSRRRRKKR